MIQHGQLTASVLVLLATMVIIYLEHALGHPIGTTGLRLVRLGQLEHNANTRRLERNNWFHSQLEHENDNLKKMSLHT